MANTPEFPCYIPTNESRECIKPGDQPYACGKCVHGQAAAEKLRIVTHSALPEVKNVHVETNTASLSVFADHYLIATVFQGAAKDATNQLIRLTTLSSAAGTQAAPTCP